VKFTLSQKCIGCKIVAITGVFAYLDLTTSTFAFGEDAKTSDTIGRRTSKVFPANAGPKVTRFHGFVTIQVGATKALRDVIPFNQEPGIGDNYLKPGEWECMISPNNNFTLGAIDVSPPS
jgi:hypothetical protein